MTTGPRPQQAVSIEEKVSFLSSPRAYAPDAGAIDVRETHMSWLFLVGDRVYKFKKPVVYPYLDFRTLAARERNCRAEVRLNRRLAPDVYLGVSRLTADGCGALSLDGEGETVEWLVVMRRLPEDRLLHNAIHRGAVARGEIERVATILGGFYRDQPPVEVRPEKQLDLFFEQQQTNREMLTDPRFSLVEDVPDRVLSAIDEVLEHEPGLVTARITAGRIVEGHGDLRPEHVCLNDPPVIIDCLEFNRTLRLLDPFDELADLAMECERLGAAWIGPLIIKRCMADLGDRPPAALMAFYTAYRACLRARLAVRHLYDTDVREPDKWLPLAREYLAIAERACVRLRPRATPPASRARGSDG